MRDFKITTTPVPINKMESGLFYQRPTSDYKRIQLMADNWCEALYEPISLSFRNGKYFIIDGQHRVSAMVKRFGENYAPICKVATDLTEQEESEWFAELASSEKSQTLNAVVAAKISSKAYPEYTKLTEDLYRAGLYLKLTFKGRKNNAIKANATIIKLHNQFSQNDFVDCMSILRSLWNGNSSSLTASFLEGWSYFYTLYHNQWDLKTLFSKLSVESASQISKHAKALADLKTYTLQQCYAKEFVTLYNGRSRKYRLDDTLIKSPTNI